MSSTQLQVVLRARPETALESGHLALVETPRPEPGDGEVLVRNRWLSLDPYMLAQINGRHVTGNLEEGEVLRGEVIGEVLQSQSERWKPGDLVRGMLGWREYAVAAAEALTLVPASIHEPRWCLSMLGMPGLTAYAAMHWQAGLNPGETVVVAAASGAVGSMAVQLAVRAGCRVVGLVGSPEKARYVIDTLGASDCILRHEESLAEGLDRTCPQGIDVCLDLVGGAFLEAVSARLAVGGRIVLAGVQKSSMVEPLSAVLPAHWIKRMVRVREREGLPFGYYSSWTMGLERTITKAQAQKKTRLELFRERGLHLSHVKQTISAVAATPELAEALQAREGQPLISLVRRSYSNTDGHEVLRDFMHIFYHPDRFQYQMDLKLDGEGSAVGSA
jgi:NADPH-dependent curcumin reductase CurA